MHQFVMKYHRELIPAIALHWQHDAAVENSMRSWRCNPTVPIHIDFLADMEFFFYPCKLCKYFRIFLRYAIAIESSFLHPRKQADTYLSACQENPAYNNDCDKFAQSSRRCKVHLPYADYLHISVAHRKLHPDVTDWQYIQQTHKTKQQIGKSWIPPHTYTAYHPPDTKRQRPREYRRKNCKEYLTN